MSRGPLTPPGLQKNRYDNWKPVKKLFTAGEDVKPGQAAPY